MSESLTRARCAACSWPLSTHPQGSPCAVPPASIVPGTLAGEAALSFLFRGARVEGDTVVISAKGGNDGARALCGALIDVQQALKGASTAPAARRSPSPAIWLSSDQVAGVDKIMVQYLPFRFGRGGKFDLAVQRPQPGNCAIDSVIRSVAELLDRSSPEDWPEAMLVTSNELRSILANQLTMMDEADRSATQAARDVLAERRRQVTAEGWTPEHDDEHDDGSLARAAACYALDRQTVRTPNSPDVILWPWENAGWKPRDPRSNLVRAGALILAEIERLDRNSAAAADVQQRQVTFVGTTGAKDFLGPTTGDRRFWPLTEAPTCSYPDCHCPFDAPSDPNWCARGWPKKPRQAPTESRT